MRYFSRGGSPTIQRGAGKGDTNQEAADGGGSPTIQSGKGRHDTKQESVEGSMEVGGRQEGGGPRQYRRAEVE